MNDYMKPEITIDGDLAEGVFAASGAGIVDFNKVSSEFKHNSYWEVKYGYTVPSDLLNKHVAVAITFAGPVFEAWCKAQHHGEEILTGNTLTFEDHSINDSDYEYYIGVQSKESEAACNIVGYSITPV